MIMMSDLFIWKLQEDNRNLVLLREMWQDYLLIYKNLFSMKKWGQEKYGKGAASFQIKH